MCGIGGIVGRRPKRDWRQWAALTAYRGPDALNVVESDSALLCHNRLSIIDRRPLSDQPMQSRDGRYSIVFNGEIYNFRELRSELEALGCRFLTRSDTEVLLNGFVEWGEAVLDKLDGMFGFCIWDAFAHRAFVARDHAGIKPLFYAAYNGSFVFGSEIKLLLESGVLPRDIRHDAVHEYLAYGYVPGPGTAYAHVNSLLPGHCGWYDLTTSTFSSRPWWVLPTGIEPMRCSLEEASSELVRLFSHSVKRRLIADVPVGAFLSGGLDSSAIVAEMVRCSGERVRTFAIGYADNPEYDESGYAREVATHLGVEHETIYPTIDGGRDLDGFLESIVRQFDQPYANATVLLTEVLTRHIREKVTVALVGDGGDELFGGYPRYWALGLQARYGGIVRLLRGPLLAVLHRLRETPAGNHRARRMRRFLTASEPDLGMAFEQSTRLFSSADLSAILRSDCGRRSAAPTLLRDIFHAAAASWLASACYTDQRSFLPFNLLEGADRMSMVNSFELRLPFLDRSLMEFCAALPQEFRIAGGVQKRILKHAYRHALPASVLTRPKRGFNPPVWQWLKANPEVVNRLLRQGNAVHDFVRVDSLRALIGRFHSNLEDSSTQLWSLLVLERWLVRNG